MRGMRISWLVLRVSPSCEIDFVTFWMDSSVTETSKSGSRTWKACAPGNVYTPVSPNRLHEGKSRISPADEQV